ncbi:MAG: pilus assembly protein PilP [Deltaproteobacteria bacterium]|jgi:type IV pilus assembly protein PilP|nr:pilus assembly protein PilP [Deltaproteobacteria bacterium]
MEAPPPLNPDKPLTPAEKAELEAKAKIQAELDAWRASVNQDYVFNAGDMIDPFMPIESVAKPADPAKQAEDRTSKPMIQQLALNQFTLSAIIVGANPDDNIALVDSGGKGYIVRKGILIGNNNGFVREITPNKVVIEEPDMSYRARNSQAAPRITEFRLNSLRESADGIELSLSE